jgi:hypothetical protein
VVTAVDSAGVSFADVVVEVEGVLLYLLNGVPRLAVLEHRNCILIILLWEKLLFTEIVLVLFSNPTHFGISTLPHSHHIFKTDPVIDGARTCSKRNAVAHGLALSYTNKSIYAFHFRSHPNHPKQAFQNILKAAPNSQVQK